MILGKAEGRKSMQGDARTTLDEIFRRVASRRPEAIALIDPPNREDFTSGAPRRLTFAQTDRLISAMAGRLRRIGLTPDTVIGVQLPNTVESVITLLAIMRAEMIAAPLPLLWRRADCVAALSRIGTKALITCDRVGAADHGALAMQVAAELFPIRYVCGFGASLPDGIIPLDDLFVAEKIDPLPPPDRERKGSPAAHVAAITFDIGADGVIPVARSHMELLAGGLAGLLESGIRQDATILSSLPVASFAGISLTLLPWLLSGGTLVLHQPFDPAALESQIKAVQPDLAVLPGPLIARLAEAGILASGSPKAVLAFWRSPERLAASALWKLDNVMLIDVPIFGEIGLLAGRREAGKPAAIPTGPVTAPRGVPGGVVVAEVARTEAGSVALNGPMVPRHPFPPGGARGAWYSLGKPEDTGAADTGYTCRHDPQTSALVVTGPPAGLVTVGGYRFVLRDVQDSVARTDESGSVAALPDPLGGHRLAGQARDRTALQHALTALGVNPLIVRAFRDRKDASPAA